MNQNIINIIVNCMPSYSSNSDIQKIQTEHRLKIANFWNIKEGSNVLEIGCGQGDTTAVLAHLVGEAGFVHAVDIASPNYGSPITLGDSLEYIKNSHLGNRIKVDFEMDVMSPEVDFPEGSFDAIVLSHSSWYLKNVEELQEIFRKSKKWGKALCFAEWDSRITTVEQYPHLLAVLIQAQYECFKKDSLSNIRSLFTPEDFRHVAENAGWKLIAEEKIDSPKLQDGTWEVEQLIEQYQEELESIMNLPSKFSALIESEIYLLKAAIEHTGIQPLSTYTFTAE